MMGGCGRLGRHNFLKVFGVAAHRSAHPGPRTYPQPIGVFPLRTLLLSNHTQLHNCSTTNPAPTNVQPTCPGTLGTLELYASARLAIPHGELFFSSHLVPGSNLLSQRTFS